MAASADTGTPTWVPRPAGLHVQLYTLGPTGPVRWRMLSGNNRDLGRGVGDFADEESCLSAIKALLARMPELEPGLSRTADGRWSWRLVLDGVVAVTSGHGFDRRTRCEQAAIRFERLLPVAEVRPGVTVLAAPGRPPVSRALPVGNPAVGLRWSPVHPGSSGRPYGSGGLPRSSRAAALDPRPSRTEPREEF
jgi:hypothetical protein